MGDVSALTAQLRELQAELVGALQAEYFCDDLAPPADALGWSEQRLRDYFESGGGAAAEPAPPAAADAPARAAVVPGQPGGGRHQPSVEAAGGTAVDMPSLAPTLKALVGGDGVAAATRYRDAVIAAGIPDLQEGLFPPDDPLISRLSSQYKPYTKVRGRGRGRGWGWGWG